MYIGDAVDLVGGTLYPSPLTYHLFFMLISEEADFEFYYFVICFVCWWLLTSILQNKIPLILVEILPH